jgi:hypothetical protein
MRLQRRLRVLFAVESASVLNWISVTLCTSSLFIIPVHQLREVCLQSAKRGMFCFTLVDATKLELIFIQLRSKLETVSSSRNPFKTIICRLKSVHKMYCKSWEHAHALTQGLLFSLDFYAVFLLISYYWSILLYNRISFLAEAIRWAVCVIDYICVSYLKQKYKSQLAT